jgi:2-keto-4-pentenoate hydratase/2-oxohepta-3-ene-1,7-dioic acid hydratase in catechol pathway
MEADIMRLLTFRYSRQHNPVDHAGIVVQGGIAPILEINSRFDRHYPNDLLELIRAGVKDIPTSGIPPIPFEQIQPQLPYPVPPKIWCIGLNYHSHAVDINAVQPEEPGSFMKPASCMFQPGGEIVLPPPEFSDDVDAEGELGVVIGRTCKHVPRESAREVIFGFTTTLDLTALDVLRKNPRYLTRSKSFDTFFSFGPVIVTEDEVPDVESLEVITEHNGAIWSRDFVRNMKMRPIELVAYHSDYMTLNPGDVISTGCPKGARIKAGDRVAARIDGVGRNDATVIQGEKTTVI